MAAKPRFQYTPPKPIIYENRKWMTHVCPDCNEPKARTGKRCRKCQLASNRPDPDPKTYRMGRDVCRRIPLTMNQYALVNVSLFDFLMQWSWRASPNKGKFYASTMVYVDNVRHFIRMHHIILGLPPGKECDHINRDTLDNRIRNLRPCTTAQNIANRGMLKSNTSGYKGVNWRKERSMWVARIGFKGERISLGMFNDPKEAAKAYDKAAIKYYGEFAGLNFPAESSLRLRV
jgi:hypothetical protein